MPLLEPHSFRSIRKLIKINGCGAYRDAYLNISAVTKDGEVIATVESYSHVEQAVDRLVDMVYKVNSEIVRKRQGYKCLLCGRLGPLEIDHHPVSRARGGRRDTTDNLRGLCHTCHAKKHGG